MLFTIILGGYLLSTVLAMIAINTYHVWTNQYLSDTDLLGFSIIWFVVIPVYLLIKLVQKLIRFSTWSSDRLVKWLKPNPYQGLVNHFRPKD